MFSNLALQIVLATGLALLILLVATPAADAAIDKRINFQGRLTDASGVPVANGTYNLEFKLHNHATNAGGAQGACSGSCLWIETRTAGNRVQVTNGHFSVQLGEVATLDAFNFDQTSLYLSVQVGGTAVGPTWDGEMTPRNRLGAAPTAIHADNALELNGELASYYTNATNISSGTLADGRLSTNVALKNADNNFSASQTITGQSILPTTGISGGLLIGTDANLYRSAANVLRTDDSLIVNANLTVNGTFTCTGCVDSTNIADGTITETDLATNLQGRLTQAPVHHVASPPGTPASSGYNTSVAIGTDGLPIVAHWRGGVRATHCEDIACTTATHTVVNTAGALVKHPSVAIGADGMPIISTFDINGALLVAHCSNISCTASTTSTIDAVVDSSYSSIAVGHDSLPIIAYYDGPNTDLVVAKCIDQACTSASKTVVDATGGLYPDIIIGPDMLPVISYRSGVAMKVAKCTDGGCTASTQTSLGAANSGYYTSITIGTDGLPIISHGSASAASGLQVSHCSNTSCTAATTTTLYLDGGTNAESSIVVGNDGLAVIAHYDKQAANRDLMFTHCNNVTCTSATTINIHITNDVGAYPSITIGMDGNPFIAYRDMTNAYLSTAHCSNPMCVPYVRWR